MPIPIIVGAAAKAAVGSMDNSKASALKMLNELLEKPPTKGPSAPRAMLLQVMLVALRDGQISDIEMKSLRELQHRHNMEGFIFDELLKRAEALNMEVGKTISIVLE